ncbi:MAG: NACHT domain-containing protein [Saprospiraceae bacterium]|nr:NACHT domain-containing protein [Saprospiraceae bacterium]
MTKFRVFVKVIFILIALALGLIWLNVFPRPEFLPREVDIEPLTYVLSILATSLLAFWKETDTKITTEIVPLNKNNEEKELRIKIREYLKERYKNRLVSKLADRFPVNIKTQTSDVGTSAEGKANFIKIDDANVNREIGEIFEQANGRLLIVGMPGSGKTTLLLRLAIELLDRPGNAIPVILNLATWRKEYKIFDEWLQRILPNEVRFSNEITEEVIDNTSFILILDGLDEVPELDRNSCLDALGRFGIKPDKQFVISSRINEYKSLKDAKVYAQIEVAPLTAEQIEKNLLANAGLRPEAKPLWNAIQKDPILKQAIESPFYLNTAQILFASERNWNEFGFTEMDVEGRQKELLRLFIDFSLVNKEKNDFPREKIWSWLSFLAKKMESSNSRTFELNDIQPWWFGTNHHHKIIWLLIWGTFVCIPVGTFVGFAGALIGPQAVVLIGILLIILIWGNSKISSNIQAGWSWYYYKRNFKKSLMWGLSWGSVLGLFGSWIGYKMGNYVGGLTGGVVWGIVWGVIISGKKTDYLLQLNKPYQRFLDWKKSLNSTFLQHFAIRLILFFNGNLPLQLTRFLNEMSRRYLLEFDGNLNTEIGGGTWRWRHRIIHEYFIHATDFEPDER